MLSNRDCIPRQIEKSSICCHRLSSQWITRFSCLRLFLVDGKALSISPACLSLMVKVSLDFDIVYYLYYYFWILQSAKETDVFISGFVASGCGMVCHSARMHAPCW